MAFREVQRMQVVEVVRRWRLGESQRSIARATGLSRNTVEKYVRAPSTLRMAEWPPGEAVEIDFGRLGTLVDATTGKRQVVSALVVVLPHSRHQFVWPLLGQTLAETIAGLEAAWRFFGGSRCPCRAPAV